ncbi:MAG: electron transfer flavoprotein subunit alpha/FixB family protein, partial [Flavobacteriaceae bacterium]|nr:electron transfer flavoprotein subunit alpha/FixB family protein [Flavobacteriaceae bacterium]
MSVLVYTESLKGKFKKNAFEAASYAHKVAQDLGTTVTAVSFNAEEDALLGTYGVSKVLKVSGDSLATFNAKAYTEVLAEAAKAEDTKVIILSSSADSKFLAPI